MFEAENYIQGSDWAVGHQKKERNTQESQGNYKGNEFFKLSSLQKI